MADITAGLPTLRPEDIQAQQDRARVGALARPVGNALLDVGTLIPRAIVGAGNQLLRVPNALGAGIPLQRLPGDSPSALPEFKMFPYSTAGAQSGGASGSFGDPVALPAMTAPANVNRQTVTGDPAAPAPVQVATAPRTPKSGGTKTAGGMPAGAPAPLIPGETGYYMNDQLVPYGTRFDVTGGNVTQIGGPGGGGGGGGGMMDGLPGGGKIVNGKFADPRDALEYGFRLQSQYRDQSMAEILRLAGSGSELGFGSKIRALASAFGSNNFGQTSVGGANSLNQAIASITSAETSAGATLGAARLRHDDGTAQLNENIYQFDNTPKPAGQTSVTDTATGLTTNQTSYALPAKRGSGGMPQVIDAAKPKPTYADGTQVKLRDGRTATMKNGKPIPD